MTASLIARAGVRSLWRSGGLGLLAPFAGYALYSQLRGDLRFDHVAVFVIVAALVLLGPRAKELVSGLYPVGLVFLLYDGMRPLQFLGVTESSVHLCDLRAVEARIFGWGGGTLHDYWQTHHSTPLDVLCAIPYSTFLLWCVAGALYLYVKDRPAMRRFTWGFFVLNVVGFLTYHLLPAAPPWYFHARGCVVDLATTASEGPALARVDALLGLSYFHGMYGRASSVFGALPSLHCAYPLLLVLEGWRASGWRLRTAGLAYYGAMVFSAVYLDHHWVLDALLGSVFAVLTAGAIHLLSRSREDSGRVGVAEAAR